MLARDPDLAALPPAIPPRVVDLIRRCLEKTPRKRWQAIGDVRYEIEAILANPHPAAAPAAPQRAPWRRVLPFAAIAVVAAALGAAALWNVRPSSAPAVVRFSITLPEGQSLGSASRGAMALSPDGRLFAYAANRQLYIRRLDSLEGTRVFANDSRVLLTSIAFSPDSQEVAFALGSGIVRMPASGGMPAAVFAGNVSGVSWSGESIVFVATQGTSRIMRVPTRGGEAETLVALGQEEFADAPQLLPDGRTILFTLATGMNIDRWDSASIVAQRIGEPSSRVTVVPRGADARYVPTGHLVYADAGILIAAAFDLKTLQLTGGPVPIVEGVARGVGMAAGGTAHYTISDSGSLAYLPGAKEATSRARLEFVLADRNGTIEKLKIPAGPYHEPRMSPDGHYIAYTVDEGTESSIWVYDRKTGDAPRRLTFGKGDHLPVWSRDSTRLAYQSQRGGDTAIFWQRADGSDVATRLTKPEKATAHVPHAWSKDGSVLLFDEQRGDSVSLMMLKHADNSVAPFGGIVSKTSTGPAFSPDGRWVSYSMRQEPNGLSMVFVQPFPATGVFYEVSKNNEDGHHAVWSRDGKQLFYTPGPGTVLSAVPVTTTATTFAMGEPQNLNRPFSNQPPQFSRPYDIATDGRFLGLGWQQALASGNGAVIQVVLNWFEELKNLR